MKLPIYLDHHSTTPCDARVVEAMAPYWTTEFGNAASRTHAFGWRAEEAVESARMNVARLIGAGAREVGGHTSTCEQRKNYIKKATFHCLARLILRNLVRSIKVNR